VLDLALERPLPPPPGQKVERKTTRKVVPRAEGAKRTRVKH
jgi:ATP-dependent Lon protease